MTREVPGDSEREENPIEPDNSFNPTPLRGAAYFRHYAKSDNQANERGGVTPNLHLFSRESSMSEMKSVPLANRPAYEAVIALTDAVCQQHLNEEWATLCRALTASLARKRPSPLLRGEPRVWAAGILHALGVVNFLFDRSQAVSMSVPDLCTAFGVKSSTVGGKSKIIREMFKMYHFDPRWSLPSKMDQNPVAWMISVNGFLLDARQAPAEIQAEAYRRGLIPYIPGQAKDEVS